MAKNRSDGLAAVIREVEGLAKRLRADLRKRTDVAGVQKALASAAAQLRKRAAAAAEQVEKYIHQLRMDLERGVKKPAKRVKPKQRPKAKPAPVTAALHL